MAKSNAGRPRAFKSVAELEKGIDAYFASPGTIQINVKDVGLLDVSEPLSVSALADSLGVNRDTLHQYSVGAYGDEYSDAIKKAVAKIERDKVSKAIVGQYDRTIAIFDLKNNHGWKDQQHIEQTGKNETVHKLDPKTAKAIADGIRTAIKGS